MAECARLARCQLNRFSVEIPIVVGIPGITFNFAGEKGSTKRFLQRIQIVIWLVPIPLLHAP